MSSLSRSLMPPTWRTNPFASRHTRPGAIQFRFAIEADANETARRRFVDEFIVHLTGHRCGQVVGDHGTGKSTLLRDIASELDRAMPGGAWLVLTRDATATPAGRVIALCSNELAAWRAQSRVSRGGVLIIDGAEQLTPISRSLVRLRCRWRGQFAIITTHRIVAGFALLHRTKLDGRVLRQLTAELLASTASDAGHSLAIDQLVDESEWDQVADARKFWSSLYDRAAAANPSQPMAGTLSPRGAGSSSMSSTS